MTNAPLILQHDATLVWPHNPLIPQHNNCRPRNATRRSLILQRNDPLMPFDNATLVLLHNNPLVIILCLLHFMHTIMTITQGLRPSGPKIPPLCPLVFKTRQTIKIPQLKSGYQVTADLCVSGSPDTRGTQLSSTPGFHPSRPESPKGFRLTILLSCYSYDVHHELYLGDPRASTKSAGRWISADPEAFES